MKRRLTYTIIGLILSLVSIKTNGLLPGLSPHDYQPGDEVELKVNKLTSVKTQLPYDFYDALPFCRPLKIVDKNENLGEIIKGDRISNSLYRLKFLQNVTCATLGEGIESEIKPNPKSANPSSCVIEYEYSSLRRFTKFITNDYLIHWEIDGLPSAYSRLNPITKNIRYDIGFPLGARDKERNVYLYNHAAITIRYYNNSISGSPDSGLRIVGFEVKPMSIDSANLPLNAEICTVGTAGAVKINSGNSGSMMKKTVRWTYSVTWIEDKEVSWGHRWERYFSNSDSQVHWFSIVNSIMVVVFLTGMIAMILTRTLHADMRKYTEHIEAQDDVEETGWKLVHGDVFRAPAHPALFSVLLGSGAQMVGTILATLIFAALGVLSPANSGALLTGMIVFVFLASAFSGYYSTRFYKMFKGTQWKKNMLLTTFFIPGIIFAIFLFLNFFVWGVKSSGGVTFGALLTLIALYFGLSIPLTFIGSFLAFRKPVIEAPVSTNQIPRQIPDQVWYMSPLLTSLIGGTLPFGAVFIELFFILGALWGQQLYYVFGFVLIVFAILMVTCAEISIVMTYFQLCAEDYHWWWRSFFTPAASSFYFFLYSVFYFSSRLSITKFISGLLYFGYTVIFSIVLFVATGFIGFVASFIFVRKIYTSIPFD